MKEVLFFLTTKEVGKSLLWNKFSTHLRLRMDLDFYRQPRTTNEKASHSLGGYLYPHYPQVPSKYAEKGKELLAKVVFYRQPEDKQKLTDNAWMEKLDNKFHGN